MMHFLAKILQAQTEGKPTLKVSKAKTTSDFKTAGMILKKKYKCLTPVDNLSSRL
jgi:hypothetical protein